MTQIKLSLPVVKISTARMSMNDYKATLGKSSGNAQKVYSNVFSSLKSKVITPVRSPNRVVNLSSGNKQGMSIAGSYGGQKLSVMSIPGTKKVTTAQMLNANVTIPNANSATLKLKGIYDNTVKKVPARTLNFDNTAKRTPKLSVSSVIKTPVRAASASLGSSSGSSSKYYVYSAPAGATPTKNVFNSRAEQTRYVNSEVKKGNVISGAN